MKETILQSGSPPFLGTEIPGEPRALPPRTFGAYSFLYAYFLDSGINGKRARAFVDYNSLEFTRSIYDLFLTFLWKAGGQQRAGEFRAMCHDLCQCFELLEISDRELDQIVATLEFITALNAERRAELLLPSLTIIDWVPLVFRSNVAAAVAVGAERYLTFDANERALAERYGLLTDFEDIPPDSF